MKIRGLAVFATIMGCLAIPASAQGPAETPAISVELNKTQAVDGSCRLTFLMKNTLAEDVERLAFEVAVVNKSGLVAGLILMRSGKLPVDRERVKQFDLPNVDCASIDRLLLNEIPECEGASGPISGCRQAVVASSRGEVGFQ